MYFCRNIYKFASLVVILTFLYCYWEDFVRDQGLSRPHCKWTSLDRQAWLLISLVFWKIRGLHTSNRIQLCILYRALSKSMRLGHQDELRLGLQSWTETCPPPLQKPLADLWENIVMRNEICFNKQFYVLVYCIVSRNNYHTEFADQTHLMEYF